MFETSDFKINEHGIDLKKNYQIYKHIDFREIIQIEIKKGFLVKNWLFSLTIGTLMIIVTSIWCIESINSFDLENLQKSSVRLYLVIHALPWILLFGSIGLIIVTLKRNFKMVIYYNKTRSWNTLREIEKKGIINELIDFLEKRTKIVVDKKAYDTK